MTVPRGRQARTPTTSAAAAAAPVGSPLERARAAVTAEPVVDDTYVADDSAASTDDEDIDTSAEVGRPVIERLLGGKVIDEG